ncbi:MAG TPA: hypothetical protein VI911_10880 [Patescibacteria group bacterium]|nr:hypothetical protein [Patescibacteria group bacterium]
MKKDQLPGDIQKLMNKVQKQTITVRLGNYDVQMTREKFTNLCKCEVFNMDNRNQAEGDEVPSGFYLMDHKAKTGKLILEVPFEKSDVGISVQGRTFKVERPLKGYTYA